MSLTGVSQVTVTGSFRKPDGSAASGKVMFTPSARLVTTNDDLVVPDPVVATLDGSGDVSVSLPATDDVDVSPSGWTWLVEERIENQKRSYSMVLASSPSTVDLADVAPVDPVSPTTTYTLSEGALTTDHGYLTGLGDDDHTQYLLKAGGTMTGKIVLDGVPTLALHPATKSYVDARTAVFYTTHTWAIYGEIKVPSSDIDFLVPMFAAEGANEVVVLDKVRYVINSGTSVTFKLQIGGVDATGFTALSCTTTATTTDAADDSLTDLDKLAPVVTAVSGTPKNMTITVFLKHTVTLA